MGYAVWDRREWCFVDFGTFSTEPDKSRRVSDDYSYRCRVLTRSLRSLFAEYPPLWVVAEMPSGGAKSARAAVQMAMSAAIVSTACALLDLPLLLTTPQQGKKVVGNGSISKQQVQRWVCNHFKVRLPDRAEIREHVADAMIALEACARNHPEGKSIYGRV